MKVVVLGGAGLTGKCAVRDLIESPEVSEVLVGDVDSERLGKFVSILGSNKVTSEVVDVRNHDSLVSLLKGANVTVNAVQYYFNLDVMKAALMARTHYVDLGGLYHMTKKQLELDEDFRKAGLTAVVGMGCVPGISNVMARWAVDRLDSVDTIRIRDGWRDFTPNAPRFVATWSIQTFTDEFTQNAVIFENGQLREVPPITLAEKVALPPPIGEIEAFATLHSELATFPTSFKEKGIKNVNWKEGGPKGWHLDYELIVALRLMRDEPLRIADRVFVSPRQFFLKQLTHNNLLGHPEDVVSDDWECSRVEVLGKKNGKSAEMQLEVLYSAKKEWKASSAQYGVGIPASIVSQMLCEGQIQKAGVLPPENCVDPTILFKELEKRNMPIMIRGPADMVSWSTSGA